jgi:hypothetical protein
VEISNNLGVKAKPILRIDDSISQGIIRASQEQKAN